MSTKVNISNFARAETDTAIKKLHHLAGGFGRWFHVRQPTPLDLGRPAIGVRPLRSL